MIETDAGIRHRFFLTLMKLKIMSGLPVYFWDPIKGEEIFVFMRTDNDE